MRRCLFLSIFLISAVMADSTYLEVENIEIKQSGQNALVAKQRALSKSAHSAFLQLFKENEDLKPFVAYAYRFSERQIQDCIYDYSINNEKSSDSFYIGEFSYRFSKNKIIQHLQQFGANTKTEEAANCVKVAIYKKDYLKHIRAISRVGAKAVSFSSEKVVLEIRNVSNFEKLNIVHVRL